MRCNCRVRVRSIPPRWRFANVRCPNRGRGRFGCALRRARSAGPICTSSRPSFRRNASTSFPVTRSLALWKQAAPIQNGSRLAIASASPGCGTRAASADIAFPAEKTSARLRASPGTTRTAATPSTPWCSKTSRTPFRRISIRCRRRRCCARGSSVIAPSSAPKSGPAAASGSSASVHRPISASRLPGTGAARCM